MGIAGGALIPLLYASMKDRWGIPNHLAFALNMIPCYLFILYYAVAGYRLRSTTIV
jgi:fucose permease